MKRVLITGATGFLGSHLCRILSEMDGVHVRAGARRRSEELDDLGVEFVRIDLTGERDEFGETVPLSEAVSTCEEIYHCAGMVSRDSRDGQAMMRLHVDGTRRLLRAAADAGTRRVVLASSSGTHAVSRDPEPILDETAPFAVEVVGDWPYYLSKIYQEKVAQELADELDLDLVLVNPSLLLGPGDRRQSSTGDVVRFLCQEIPAVPSGGLSFVDVRDAAKATIAAMDRGRSGERYLLGGPNWTFAEFFGRLERASKIRGPILKLPKQVALWGATLMEHWYRARGNDPPIDRASIEMGQVYWYCDSAKARRELGFEPRDPTETIADTVRDVRESVLVT